MTRDEQSAVPEPVARTPRADVRRRILDAAEAEFAQRGYADASLASIAKLAGFTKGAVYSNFESKQALLADVLAERAVGVIDGAMTRLTAGGRDAATLAQRAGVELAEQIDSSSPWHALTAELAVQAVRDPDAAQAFRRFRQTQRRLLADTLHGHAAALGLPGTAVDHAALVLLAALNGLALEHAADPAALDRGSVAAVLQQVLAGLIPTTAGTEIS